MSVSIEPSKTYALNIHLMFFGLRNRYCLARQLLINTQSSYLGVLNVRKRNHVAKSGLNAQQVRMQVIANNLSNVNTAGFKRDRANFESLLYQVRRLSGDQTFTEDTELSSSYAVGTGVRIVNTEKMHSQGSLMMTDNALDLAIEGSGFFPSSVARRANCLYQKWVIHAE